MMLKLIVSAGVLLSFGPFGSSADNDRCLGNHVRSIRSSRRWQPTSSCRLVERFL